MVAREASMPSTALTVHIPVGETYGNGHAPRDRDNTKRHGESEERAHDNVDYPSFEEIYEQRVEVLKRMGYVIRKAQQVLGNVQLQSLPPATRKRNAARFDSICASYVIHMNSLSMYCLAHRRVQECGILLKESRKLTKPVWGKRSSDLRVLTLNSLACMYRANNDCDSAIQVLKEALKLSRHLAPDSEHLPVTHLLMCATLSITQRHEAAYKQATLAVCLARRAAQEVNERVLAKTCPRRASRMQLRNLRVVASLGFYNAAIESDFLGMQAASREYLRKADGILRRSISWHLEYAVCPSERERALGAHDSSTNRPSFDVLAMEPYYWRLEQDKSLWGDDLFQAWHTIRVPGGSRVRSRKGKALPLDSPTKALRDALQRRTPLGASGRHFADEQTSPMLSQTSLESTNSDHIGTASHIQQVRALRHRPFDPRTAQHTSITNVSQRSPAPVQAPDEILVEQPLLNSLSCMPTRLAGATASTSPRGISSRSQSRLSRLSTPKQQTRSALLSSVDDNGKKEVQANHTTSSRSRSRAKKQQQRQLAQRLAAPRRPQSASSPQHTNGRHPANHAKHMATFEVSSRTRKNMLRHMRRPQSAQPALQTHSPKKTVKSKKQNGPIKSKNPNKPKELIRESLVSSAILSAGSETVHDYHEQIDGNDAIDDQMRSNANRGSDPRFDAESPMGQEADQLALAEADLERARSIEAKIKTFDEEQDLHEAKTHPCDTENQVETQGNVVFSIGNKSETLTHGDETQQNVENYKVQPEAKFDARLHEESKLQASEYEESKLQAWGQEDSQEVKAQEKHQALLIENKVEAPSASVDEKASPRDIETDTSETQANKDAHTFVVDAENPRRINTPENFAEANIDVQCKSLTEAKAKNLRSVSEPNDAKIARTTPRGMQVVPTSLVEGKEVEYSSKLERAEEDALSLIHNTAKDLDTEAHSLTANIPDFSENLSIQTTQHAAIHQKVEESDLEQVQASSNVNTVAQTEMTIALDTLAAQNIAQDISSEAKDTSRQRGSSLTEQASLCASSRAASQAQEESEAEEAEAEAEAEAKEHEGENNADDRTCDSELISSVSGAHHPPNDDEKDQAQKGKSMDPMTLSCEAKGDLEDSIQAQEDTSVGAENEQKDQDQDLMEYTTMEDLLSEKTSSCSTFSSAPSAMYMSLGDAELSMGSTSSCSTFSSAPSAMFLSFEGTGGFPEKSMESSSSCSTFSSAGSLAFMSLDDDADFPSDPSVSSFSSYEPSILSLEPAPH